MREKPDSNLLTRIVKTLNSIIDNYKGDPALVELAKQKLEQIEQMEKSGRRKPSTDTNDDEELNFDNN